MIVIEIAACLILAYCLIILLPFVIPIIMIVFTQLITIVLSPILLLFAFIVLCLKRLQQFLKKDK